MSNAYITAVLNRTPELTPTQFAVMIAIGDAANDDTRVTYLKIATLERRAHLKRATVFKVLAELEERGWIRREARTGRSSIFHVLFDHRGDRLTEREWLEQGCSCEDCQGGPRDGRGRESTRPSRGRGGPRDGRGGPRDGPITQSIPGPIHKSDDTSPGDKKDPIPMPAHVSEHLSALRRGGGRGSKAET